MLRRRGRREKRARERETRAAARAVPLYHARGWFRRAFDGCAQGWAAAPPGDDLAALLPQNTLQPVALQLHKCPRDGPAGFLPSNELSWWPVHACCGSHDSHNIRCVQRTPTYHLLLWHSVPREECITGCLNSALYNLSPQKKDVLLRKPLVAVQQCHSEMGFWGHLTVNHS